MQSNSMLTPQPYQGPTDQEIEQCCMLLRLTYQSTNDQERAKAEETLKLGVKDSKKFLQLLLAIAISQNPSNITYSVARLIEFDEKMKILKSKLKMQRPITLTT
mgnify:CR=1 FL=1